MTKFDDVDLGTDRTMQRIMQAEIAKRNAVIEECAAVVDQWAGVREEEIARSIRALKQPITGM